MEINAPSSSRTPANDRRSPEKRAKRDKANKNKERMEKPHKLIVIVIKEEWILPKGKTYGNFFNQKKFPENVQNWPIIKHHIQER
jgi:hypothetical protein